MLIVNTDECQGSIGTAIEYPSTIRTLASPNYPSDYPRSKDCYWKISVASGLIKLTFVDFKVDTYDDELKVSSRHLNISCIYC